MRLFTWVVISFCQCIPNSNYSNKEQMEGQEARRTGQESQKDGRTKEWEDEKMKG